MSINEQDFKNLVSQFFKTVKEQNQAFDTILKHCIDGYNAGSDGKPCKNLTRFLQVFNADNNSIAHDLLASGAVWLKDTTNIKTISLNPATNKLVITTQESDTAITMPTQSYPEWLKATKADKAIVVTEETLIKQLKGLLTKAEKYGLNPYKILAKGAEDYITVPEAQTV